MVGNHIMCFIGDKKLINVTDAEIKDAGMIGLWTKADASSSFDDIPVMTGRRSDRDSARPVGPAKPKDKDKDDDDGNEKLRRPPVMIRQIKGKTTGATART